MNVHFQYQLDQKQKTEWIEFLQNSKHSFAQQHYIYGEIERAKGRIPVYVYGENGGKLICTGVFSIRLLFFGKYFSLEAVCHRGPVFDDTAYIEDFLLQVISYFKKLFVGSVRIAPYWFFPESEEVESIFKKMGFKPYIASPHIINRMRGLNVSTRSSTALVDLQRSEEEIFASFSKSTRREIRRAERANVYIRPTKDISEANKFFELLHEMGVERGFMLPDYSEFRGTFENVLKDEDMGILLSAFSASIFLGGIWIIRCPNYAHACRYVVVRKPLKELSNLRIGPILWLKGMLWAKEKGCQFFDMGGPADDVDKSNPLYKVNKFKQGFSPICCEVTRQHTYKCSSLANSTFEIYKFWSTGLRISKRLLHQVFK